MELTEAWLSSFHHLKKAGPRQINAGEPVDAASERGAQQDTVLCARTRVTAASRDRYDHPR